MRGSHFIFGWVNLFHCKSYKINLKSGVSYIDSLDLIVNKIATIHSINKDEICFQYAATVALNYEEMRKNSQRISNKCN